MKKILLPLVVSEAYLFFTLIILFLGPVSFKIHNLYIFCTLIILYHGFFILGYLAEAFGRVGRRIPAERRFSPSMFHVLLAFGVASLFLTYKNAMISDSIIPDEFFNNLIRGLMDPASAYDERANRLEDGGSFSSRTVNILSLSFAFCKLLFIFYSIYYWTFLSRVNRWFFILYSFFFLSIGISAGINSIIFQYFLFTSTSILVIKFVKSPTFFLRSVIVSAVVLVIPIFSFGYIMTQRGGDVDFIGAASPLGDIGMRYDSLQELDSSSPLSFVVYSLSWISSYLVQGYYGFSLILGLDWNWTYGFGNSAFSQRQLFMLTGIDVGVVTFQHRVSRVWDETAQWHSFYGQFANDFSIPGVGVLMFFLGYYLSAVWRSVLFRNSFFGAALLPIFAILIIFIPANNQVFGFIDTFSYFTVVSLCFYFEKFRVRWK